MNGFASSEAFVDVRGLLEAHRGYRTAHPSLLNAIIDLLDGGSLQPDAAPLLDVYNHSEAVTRARHLGLLAPGSHHSKRMTTDHSGSR